MNNQEIELLVASWIACGNAAQGSEEHEKHFWAVNRVMDLELDDPELLWKLILEITEFELSEKAASSLAAGPVESLLAHHGKDFIDRIEKEARENSRFRDILRGVWQNLMPDDIWARVEKAADHENYRQ